MRRPAWACGCVPYHGGRQAAKATRGRDLLTIRPLPAKAARSPDGREPAIAGSPRSTPASVVWPARSSAGPTDGESVAQGSVDGPGNLLARSGAHRVAQRVSPAIGAHRTRVETQLGEDRGVVDIGGELFSATLRGGVLDAHQTRVPVFGRDPQQVLADGGDRAPCALLPRRIGRGLHDDLADDSPARVARFAARNEKPSQRVREDRAVRLRAVGIEMP